MIVNLVIIVIKIDKVGGKIIIIGDKGILIQFYIEDIKYVFNLKIVKVLVENSEVCKQYIDFGCKGVRFFNVGGKDKIGYWVVSNGFYKYYWGGVLFSMEFCVCGVNKICLDKSKMCNCDVRDNVWRRDYGWLIFIFDLFVI